jgi:hypothetical protein
VTEGRTGENKNTTKETMTTGCRETTVFSMTTGSIATVPVVCSEEKEENKGLLAAEGSPFSSLAKIAVCTS